MKVILLKNIAKLGKQHEVKEVSDGYANNYLFANNLAKPVDKTGLIIAKKQRAIMAEKATQDLEKFAKMAQKMDGLEVEIAVKAGDKGQLFEKLNPKKIATRLQEMGYDIDQDQVVLDIAIAEVGEHDVKIVFEHDLEASVKVIVEKEV
ncbi:MAG: 50S ribosomal protein L9 [Candidatus Gribaldobacteria bacterium]|nr:50S ribosomal protein L9 [Candidatus Gribaldobacteria bacterium]